MDGFARGVLGLTILAGVACANGLIGCATGTQIDGPATIAGEDADSGTSGGMDDSGMPPDPGMDAGSGNQMGKDSGTSIDAGKDSGGGSCAGVLVINEVQTAGGSASDEFVELYNSAACALSLNKFTLNYSSSGGSAPSPIFVGSSSDSIPGKGYFVLKGSGFAGSSNGKLTGGLAADGRLGVTNDTGKLIDAVGWGTLTGGTYVEKNAAPAPATNKSIGRKPDGTDTDNNAVDFAVLNSPSPGAAN